MRVAILVLGLIGSILALAVGACAGACAGALGGMGEAIEQGVTEAAEQSGEGLTTRTRLDSLNSRRDSLEQMKLLPRSEMWQCLPVPRGFLA